MTVPARSDSTSDSTVVGVALGARSYDIVIGRGVVNALGARIAALRPGAKICIVTDENVERHVLPAVMPSLERAGLTTGSVCVPPGEGSKSFRYLEQVCEIDLEIPH